MQQWHAALLNHSKKTHADAHEELESILIRTGLAIIHAGMRIARVVAPLLGMPTVPLDTPDALRAEPPQDLPFIHVVASLLQLIRIFPDLVRANRLVEADDRLRAVVDDRIHRVTASFEKAQWARSRKLSRDQVTDLTTTLRDLVTRLLRETPSLPLKSTLTQALPAAAGRGSAPALNPKKVAAAYTAMRAAHPEWSRKRTVIELATRFGTAQRTIEQSLPPTTP